MWFRSGTGKAAKARQLHHFTRGIFTPSFHAPNEAPPVPAIWSDITPSQTTTWSTISPSETTIWTLIEP